MKLNSILWFSGLALSALVMSHTSFAAEQKPLAIRVKMTPAAKETAKGSFVVRSLEDGRVEIRGRLVGLKEGKHGMHVHTVGDCSDPNDGFKKAGAHFNPDNTQHGTMERGHGGDLGNIEASKEGRAHFSIQTTQFSVDPASPKYIVGRALVIHADADDEKTDPAGNSGSRILCGVIAEASK